MPRAARTLPEGKLENRDFINTITMETIMSQEGFKTYYIGQVDKAAFFLGEELTTDNACFIKKFIDTLFAIRMYLKDDDCCDENTLREELMSIVYYLGSESEAVNAKDTAEVICSLHEIYKIL